MLVVTKIPCFPVVFWQLPLPAHHLPHPLQRLTARCDSDTIMQSCQVDLGKSPYQDPKKSQDSSFFF